MKGTLFSEKRPRASREHSRIPRRRAIVLALILFVTLDAANLVWNGGFELGSDGFDTTRALRLDANPKGEFTPAVVEGGAAPGGKKFLRLPNPYGECVELWGREIVLTGNTTYTVSFTARAEAEGLPLQANLLSIDEKWIGYAKAFTLGSAWKRFTYTFTTEAHPPRYFAPYFRFGFAADAPRSDFFLDDLMVEAGKDASAFAPMAPVEAVVGMGGMLHVAEGRKEVAAALKLVNHGDEAWSEKLRVSWVEDWEGGRSILLTNLAVELAAGERKEISLPIALAKYGAFSLSVTNEGAGALAAHAAYFAVVGPVQARTVDLDKDFCVSINGGVEQIPDAKGWYPKPGTRANGMGPRDYFRLLSLMGCRLVRVWDPGGAFDLAAIEPEEGRRDFTLADRTVAFAAEFGIQVLPVLGGTGFTCSESRGKGWPAWVRSRSLKVPPPEWMKKNTDYVAIPPDDAWRGYVRALVERYRGRITHWEIGNEPNLYLTAGQYVPLLKSASETIRQADPRAKVIGFCTTGDLGGQVAAFFKEAYGLGSLPSADSVSFHPYDAPELGSLTPADRQIDTARELMKAHGPVKPLWNSELYYVHDMETKHWYDKEKAPAEYAARRFLTDLGEGLAQGISLHRNALFRQTLTGHVRHNEATTRWQPSDIFVAYNALARLFESAKPVKKLRFTPDCVAYVYEKDGRLCAALWHYGKRRDVRARLSFAEGSAEAFDLFGNALGSASGSFALETKPYYFRQKAGERAAFLAAVEGALIETDQAFEFGTARFIPRARGGWEMAAAMRNTTARDVPLRLALAGEGVEAQNIAEALLAPGATTNLSVPVRFTGSVAPVSNVAVRASGGSGILSFPVAMGNPGRVLELKAEWSLPQALAIAAGGKAVAHQASFTALVKRKSLVVTVDVVDRTPSGEGAGREPWEQDCVELFLDADPCFVPMKGQGVYHDRVARLFVNPHAPKEAMLRFLPRALGRFSAERVKVAVKAKADGYQVEIEIPFDAIGLENPAGALLGFDLAVDDAEGAAKANAQLLWSSRGDAYRNRDQFGFLVLPEKF